ncbi:MAG: NADH dehydrogenase [Bradymonadia bacterium]
MIIGGGFGGLCVAQRLASQPCEVAIIDRRNHHLFQPLLYQVATAGLSPADIAAPIRGVLRGQANATVVMADVSGIDTTRRTVTTADRQFDYDYLVVAAGATHAYFGHPEWEEHAPGLKSIEDALEIRRRVLLAFEAAEHATDEAERRRKLTFVVVGGGPTGVELAGALREIAVETIAQDFRHIDTSSARVLLVEGQDRLLAAMSENAGARALEDLTTMGVEVMLSSFVTSIEADRVVVGDDIIGTNTVVWAAGVQASSLGGMLGATLDRAGRVHVEPDCSVLGLTDVFVIGDMAHLVDPVSGEQVPGVAQGALQMGEHVAAEIATAIDGPSSKRPERVFVYNDKGSMATIGRARAVVDIGGRTVGGFVAWLLWCFVHVVFLVEFRNRAAVMLHWMWAYLAHVRGARLITEARGEKP